MENTCNFVTSVNKKQNLQNNLTKYIVIYKMKGTFSAEQANNQQWDSIVLKKKKKSDTVDNSKQVLSDDVKIERQKTISSVLRQEVQKARLSKKITQKELAILASIPFNAIQEYETGKRIFNEAEVIKLERALKCKLRRK
jgi:ribosome-binding protein aMBF1 (putative translation factor)